MAKGDPITSPHVLLQAADSQGLFIRITITFNNNTRALTGATLHRDVGCAYNHLYLGVGADGSPDSATKTFKNLPTGDTPVSAAQLAAKGLNTAEDCLAFQITAGP
jgi:hypothetical protein